MAEASTPLYVADGKYYTVVGCESCNYNEVKTYFFKSHFLKINFYRPLILAMMDIIYVLCQSFIVELIIMQEHSLGSG
jgi:hypothetical protein